MKNLMPFSESWVNFLSDALPNFSSYLQPACLKNDLKCDKNHDFRHPYSPTPYYYYKLEFPFFSATVRELLPNERRYGPGVFAKISPIYPFVQLSGPILSIVYRFSQKWFRLKVIDMVSVSWIYDFLRNYPVLRLAGYSENGACYEKSDAIFGILSKFPFKYIT